MNLKELQEGWKDEEWYHQRIHERFCNYVTSDETLNRHRSWVENNVFGLGERSFHYLWLLILNEVPKDFSFLEIGCLKGQILSLIAYISKYSGKISHVYGITPMDSTGDVWDADYEASIKQIHDEFEVSQPTIYKGLSEDPEIIKQAKSTAPYSIVYVDGGHEKRHIDNDLLHYAPLVKQGGYLVIDDACNDLKMPWGYFQGIQPVTDGVLEYMNENGNDWEFVTNVVHLRVYKRK